mmetsp:Transcript_59638/g.144070  ORF Transcript_59638/g.144070 Transcript_59638/m.144070 type:complete len:1592 (+) Transcript_59638:79-4854(+)
MKLLFALLALLFVVNTWAQTATQTEGGDVTLRYTGDNYDDTWIIPTIGGGIEQLKVNVETLSIKQAAKVGRDIVKTLSDGQYNLDISYAAGAGKAAFVNEAGEEKLLVQWTESEITFNPDVAGEIQASAKNEDDSPEGSFSLSWYQPCPFGFTNLHSDFDPVLDAANSKLRLDNGTPYLDVVFSLPNYYFNVATSYKSVCNNDPSLSAIIGTGSGGCEVRYTSTINYNQEQCQFELTQANNGDDFSYHGTLYISAELTLTVGSTVGSTFNVIRQVESPLSWVVYLERTVSVDSTITLNNTDTCSSDADCGPNDTNAPGSPATAQQAQGCCEAVDAAAANPEYYCNCDCATNGNGYDGKFCEEDVTPPTCDIDADGDGFATITLSSTNGGCVYLGGGDFTDPTFGDNSGTFYVSRKVLDGDGAAVEGPTTEQGNGYNNNDLTDGSTFCFSVGNHRIEWHVADVDSTTAHTANEHTICGYDIVVEDDASPYIDCAQCNGANGGTQALLCVAGTLTGPVLQANLASYFDASNANSASTSFAGDTLNCECSGPQPSPIEHSPSQTKNPWGAIFTIDVNDATVTHDGGLPTTANQNEGLQTVVYTATDQSSNSDSCSIKYIYDNTPPSCTSVNLGTKNPESVAHPIHTDTTIFGNNTEAVTWTDPSVAASTIDANAAGFKNITLGNLHKDGVDTGSPPTSGQTFPIPVDSTDGTVTYTATYDVYDLAGNKGQCDWTLTVENPEPCIWPDCEDRAPVCNTNAHTFISNTVTLDCDADVNFADLGETNYNYLGTVVNSDTIIKDDRGIVAATFSLNGATDGSQPTKLDDNTLIYTGCDYHGDINDPTASTLSGGCVSCGWTVHIDDSGDPEITCPQLEGSTTNVSATAATYTYTYTVSAQDSCTLNTGVTLSGGEQTDQSLSDTTGSYDASHTLTPGQTYSFHWTATDSSGNTDTCSWSIRVQDNGKPTITCPDDEYLRNDQGTTTSTYAFQGSASDDVDGDLTSSIVYTLDGNTIDNTHAFTVGTNLVIGTVTDANGNQDTCNFTVIVAECYPDAEIIPTLTKADIVITSTDKYADDSVRTFEAQLELTILTNEYHSITGLALQTGSGNQAATFVSSADQSDDTCQSESEVCFYTYTSTAGLGSDCAAAERNFDYVASWKCEDGINTDPVEDVCDTATGTEGFIATLTASNYCWQELIAGGLSPEADLFLSLKTEFDNWVTDTTNPADTSNLPTQSTTFNNKAEIAGLVVIKSTEEGASGLGDGAYKGLTWVTLTKSHYPTANWEANGISPINTFDLLNLGSTSSGSSNFVKHDSTTGEDKNWAAFTYTEDDVDLEAVDYVHYEGTLEIADLNLGARRLMNVRHLLQNGDSLFAEAAAEAFMSAEPIAATVNSNEDDAVIVLMLQNCADANSEWETALVNSIAKFLRIDTSRVTVSLDPTSEGYCLVEVTIEQSECADNVDIISLLEYLETGIMDSFSELHTIVAQELPTDVTLDRSMFFVAQVPSTVYTAEAVTSSSSTTSDNGSELEWYYYAVAGFIAGLTVVVGLSYVCGNKTKASPQHTQLTPERRYSIADLLAATERRSSIDVNNVRLHNAL